MEEVSNRSPAIAVPMTVKIPEPMTAPMPSDVSDTGPRVLRSLCSGSSDSAMSLSMDLQQKAWRGRVQLLRLENAIRGVYSGARSLRCRAIPADSRNRRGLPDLTFALAAYQLFNLLLVGAPRGGAGGLGSGLLACRALHFLAFRLVFNRLCICHSFPYLVWSR